MKIMHSLYILAAITSLPLYAVPVCSDNYGTLHCEKGNINNIYYRGLVDLEQTTVSNMFDVRGNINIHQANLNKVSIRGGSFIYDTNIAGEVLATGSGNYKNTILWQRSKLLGNIFANQVKFKHDANIIGILKCNQCIFDKSVTLVGDVKLNHSVLNEDLTINSKYSAFTDTILKNIYVNASRDHEAQTLEFFPGSRVNNITFENQQGTVIVHDNVKITGAIVGAKVIRR